MEVGCRQVAFAIVVALGASILSGEWAVFCSRGRPKKGLGSLSVTNSKLEGKQVNVRGQPSSPTFSTEFHEALQVGTKKSVQSKDTDSFMLKSAPVSFMSGFKSALDYVFDDSWSSAFPI
eukprot:gnl/MRDRNA2_/MRDRNA2_37107_c0_seq1.p1 gnl/MRDRNA2_/MRDRNA2_37107_c0~~gnl/MRDRNA2_/MRDRNA2_37107_c0_seq1.p1  ORF type:complete len:120 (+),score=23.75 gnl/MRDRNA2_/MRDRNA2_37107_c0_seq1:85-444(+)